MSWLIALHRAALERVDHAGGGPPASDNMIWDDLDNITWDDGDNLVWD